MKVNPSVTHMHAPVSFRYIYPIFLGSQALNEFIFHSRSCLDPESCSLVGSPSTSLVRGEARERKEKVNKIKFPRLTQTLLQGMSCVYPRAKHRWAADAV